MAATFLVVIVLSVRALGRMDAGAGQGANSSLPPDWGPVVGFGVLALVVGLTAVVLLWVGHRVIGAVQLALCAVLVAHTLGFWP
ncbi:inner-membrane translocator [Streptomyces torulosus]|uniref:inner-membrane translocator n=1 Tax=Streptomyces torulosus TaxID=68276 RepID=UPI001F0B0890|nr:inner-membrane translocator [Streptomyces torulosus]